ncbi:MAG: MFS transporter [Solirubrobacteraceae bacterium]|nr:MFS transporter [Solirubrobacteraceae bacterium]
MSPDLEKPVPDRRDHGPSADATDRARWISLYVLCTGVLMIVLDVTVVNVALPSIQGDLGFTDSSLAWVVNAYLVPFGGLLLLAGRLSDLMGRKLLFVAGLVLFVAASALCGLSSSQEMLIGARFVQGIGGALASAVVLGMIVTMFPEPREQAKAIGTFTFVAVAGGTIGLLVGGALTEALSWHWIFFINVPVGIATVALAQRLLERDRGAGFGDGADLPGATLITTGVMLSVYTIVKAADEGWASTHTLVLGAISVVLVAGFFVRESTARSPLMPLSILRAPNVGAANAIMGLSMVGFFGIGFLGALYLQRVLAYSPVEVGFAFLPATLIMGALSLKYTERVIVRFGPKIVLTVGMALVVVSLVLFARVPVKGDYVVDLLPALVFQGLGAGLAFPALMMLSMSGAAPEQAGLASGLIQTTQQVAGALGLAVIATLSATKAEDLVADGRSEAAALTSGYHLAFVIGAVAVSIAVALAITLIKAPAGLPGHGHGAPEGDGATEPVVAPVHV